MKYLKNLNPRIGENNPWLPSVKPDLDDNSLIVVAHDWFSQGSYIRGAFYLDEDNNKIKELQEHDSTVVVNEYDYIFEEGSSDYKGLIAISFNSSDSLPKYFVLDAFLYDDEINLIFDKGTDWKYIQNVYTFIEKEYAGFDVSMRIDQVSLTFDSYKILVKDLSTQDLVLV